MPRISFRMTHAHYSQTAYVYRLLQLAPPFPEVAMHTPPQLAVACRRELLVSGRKRVPLM